MRRRELQCHDRDIDCEFADFLRTLLFASLHGHAREPTRTRLPHQLKQRVETVLRQYIRCRAGGIELARGDFVDVDEGDRANVKPRRRPGSEHAWDKDLARRSMACEPLVEMIDETLHVRAPNSLGVPTDIGL